MSKQFEGDQQLLKNAGRFMTALIQVVQRGSLSKAEEGDAMSYRMARTALKDMEEVIGEPLITRSTGMIVPTEAGEKLYRAFVKVADNFIDTMNPHGTFDPKTEEASFCVACDQDVAATITPALLERVCETAPNISIEMDVYHPDRPVDYAIHLVVSKTKFQSNLWEWRQFYEDEWVRATPKVASPQDAPVVISQDLEFRPLIEQFFSNRAIHLVPDPMAACFHATQMNAETYLPSKLLSLMPEHNREQLRFDTDRLVVYMGYRKIDSLSPQQQWLRKVVREAAKLSDEKLGNIA